MRVVHTYYAQGNQLPLVFQGGTVSTCLYFRRLSTLTNHPAENNPLIRRLACHLDLASGFAPPSRQRESRWTDTGVDKTVVSSLLCAALDAIYWKPIQTGGVAQSSGQPPSLWRAAGRVGFRLACAKRGALAAPGELAREVEDDRSGGFRRAPSRGGFPSVSVLVSDFQDIKIRPREKEKTERGRSSAAQRNRP